MFLTSMLDPKVAAVTGLVGRRVCSIACGRLSAQLGERTTVLMGTMSAFVFAAQMVNFPVGSWRLGPPAGRCARCGAAGSVGRGGVVIAAVLLVQCFLFADGGVTALGANFVNMGLVGSVGGYAIYAPIRRADRRPERDLDRRHGCRMVLGAPGGGCARTRTGRSRATGRRSSRS